MEKLSPGSLSGISENNTVRDEPKENISKIYTISEITQIVTPIASRYGVASVWLFGSYARGEATAESDVDLLIDGGAVHSLYQLTAFRLDLEDALQKSVDIVTIGNQDQVFVQRIRADEVILYEAA